MNLYTILAVIGAAFLSSVAYITRPKTLVPPQVAMPLTPQPSIIPAEATASSVPVLAPVESIDTLYPSWATQQDAYHNARVLCDNSGLTLAEKNLISACLYQESRFKVGAVNHNENGVGDILSTDYGIAQINDFYHIGAGKDFPSVEYVMDNPAKTVQFMINKYLQGRLSMWVSYSSGDYKQWLTASSPMWKLASA